MSGIGRKLVVFSAVAVIVLLIVNLLLSYAANYLIRSAGLQDIRTDNTQLHMRANVAIFPSLKLGLEDVRYTFKDKSLIDMGNISAKVSLLALFENKLTIKELRCDDLSVNLIQVIPFLKQMPWEMQEVSSEEEGTDGEEEQGAADLETPLKVRESIRAEEFFAIRRIRFSNINLVYSEDQSPLHIDRFSLTKGNALSMQLEGSVGNGPHAMQMSGTLDGQGKDFLQLKLLQGNNKFFMILTHTEAGMRGDMAGAFPARAALEALFGRAAKWLPTGMEIAFVQKGHTVMVSPFIMNFLHGRIQAAALINTRQTPAFTFNLRLSPSLLDAVPSTDDCILPSFMVEMLQEMQTRLAIGLISGAKLSDEGPLYGANINEKGIEFDGLSPPQHVQQRLQACF